tara:strand:+ start:442 stop:1083 length:642 start_codon:yes stop_codon:yes gene_type:complete
MILSNISNFNVYFTNILLLIIISINILILNDLHKWDKNEKKYKHSFIIYGYISLLIFIIGFTFSNIHHIFMFTNKNTLYNIGHLDQITAKIIGILLFILFIIYTLFVIHKNYNNCKNLIHINTDNKCENIYIIGCIYIFIGVSIFIFKHFFEFNQKTLKNRKLTSINSVLLYTTTHTAFHYTSYIGIILIYVIYYIQLNDIYTVLIDKCIENN